MTIVMVFAMASAHAGVAADRVALLTAKAQSAGRVRVIVGIQNGAVAEHLLSDNAAVATQRTKTAGDLRAVAADAAGRGEVYSVAPFTTLPAAVMEVDANALAALGNNATVTSITEDRLAKPRYTSASVTLIGGPTVWAEGYTGVGQAVAILDTGMATAHPYLGGRVVAEACFSTTSSSYGSTTLCPNGTSSQTGTGSGVNCSVILTSDCEHGTHVAGIAAGYQSTSFSGVAPGASIISVQVYSLFSGSECQGSGSYTCVLSWTSDQIRGMEYIYQLRNSYSIAAVNLSLGGDTYTSQATCDSDNADQKTAVDNLRAVNIATVIAAGNDAIDNAISAPACISTAFAVSSTTVSDTLSSFTNIASFVSYLAPGTNIASSVPGGGYAIWSGTSMATPHVAGAFALLRSARPTATIDQIAQALTKGGTMLTFTLTPGQTSYTYTLPRINVAAALPDVGTVTVVPDTGWWWSASEPGRGYGIEVDNNRIMIAAYMYRANGTPVWYVASGPYSTSGFSGALTEYSGGETLSSNPSTQVTALASSATVTLAFTSTTKGTITWSGSAFSSGAVTTSITRYPIDGSSVKAATTGAPASGWWWNPADAGSGYFIEQQGTQIFLIAYLYAADGTDRWYYALGTPVTSNGVFGATGAQILTAALMEAIGGQTLTGAVQTPAETSVGTMTLTVSSSTAATIILPSGRQVVLTPFTQF
ncbi:MAG: S8 family serine peptidase [Azospirillaceae bacterium]|nr:S8 family serine peptidase [Azospirillaceae bacterium]